MSQEPHIENGFASVDKGSWIVRSGQPSASVGAHIVRGLKGFIVPDRREVQVVESRGVIHCGCATKPFLTQLTVTDEMKVVSSKLLLAPSSIRKGGKLLRVIPMTLRHSFPITMLSLGWVILSTRSRVKRIVLEEGEIATVRKEAAVAWTGKDPNGYCPRLRLRDVFLPARRSVGLSLNFYGPQIIWVEGCDEF